MPHAGTGTTSSATGRARSARPDHHSIACLSASIGEHAVKGTEGAEVIPELDVEDGGLRLGETCSSLYDTGLGQLLKGLGAQTLYLTGLHTNMCCRHTAADAYFRGYDLVAVEDGCEAFSEEDHQDGLDYLEQVYGADIMPTAAIIGRWETAAVAA